MGPDSGYLNWQSWLTSFLTPTTSPLLHAVTHHVYNGVSRKTWNSPKQLDSILPEVQWYRSLVSAQAPGAQVWAGENGPIGGGDDGSCGNNSVCGTFASAVCECRARTRSTPSRGHKTLFYIHLYTHPWNATGYADDMSLRATHGFSQHNRQDLWGGHYGLVNSVTGKMELDASAPLLISPDFWVNFLWKRLLGWDAVYNVTSSDPMVRAYAFSGTPPSPFGRAECGQTMQLLALNLHNVSVQAVIPFAKNFYVWSLSPGPDGVFGGSAALNGVAFPRVIDAAKVDPASFLEGVSVPPVAAYGPSGLQLPASSISFLCGSNK